MPDLIVTRALPGAEAVDALVEALKSALGTRCPGMSAKVGGKNASQHTIIVHLTDDATHEDENIARQIVLTHDFTLRTSGQLARTQRDERLQALRTAIDAKQVKLAGDPVLEWLMLEIEVIKERLGITDT